MKKPLLITGIKTKEQYDACYTKISPSSDNHWNIKNSLDPYPNFYFEGNPSSDFYNFYDQSKAKKYTILSVSQFLKNPLSFNTLYNSL